MTSPITDRLTEIRLPHEPDYIARTIATVRNHKHADNCWPQWANIFADEIEGLWAERDAALAVVSQLQDVCRESRELAVSVMDKDIGDVSEEARTLLGLINRTLGDLPTADDVAGILSVSPGSEETE